MAGLQSEVPLFLTVVVLLHPEEPAQKLVPVHGLVAVRVEVLHQRSGLRVRHSELERLKELLLELLGRQDRDERADEDLVAVPVKVPPDG